MTANERSPADERYSLYRFFSARMELLYVGITNDPWRRQRQHAREKPWYPAAKHFAVTFHDPEADARKAELKAIRGESPRFNIADLPAPAPADFSVRQGVAALVCSALMAVPMALSIPLGIWHLRMPEEASVPILGTALLALAALWLIMFTSQIRRFLAWIDRHVVDVPSSGNRPGIIRVGLRLYQFHGAVGAPITYRRALLNVLAPASAIVQINDRRQA